MAFLSEASVERVLLQQLKALGYELARDQDIGPDGLHSQRNSYDEVFLIRRLEAAINRLNPHLPLEARTDALRRVTYDSLPNLLEENRRLHRLLVEGVPVEYRDTDGAMRAGRVQLLSFETPFDNDWLAVSQFVVIQGGNNRRPDVVIFVNGLPLAVIELKAPGSVNASLSGAHQQLQTYKQQISSLFYANALLVISDGLTARLGSLSADLERFMPWRTIDGEEVAPKGSAELEVLIGGVFAPHRLLELLERFTVFVEGDQGLTKIVAGYHQYHAVRRAVESTVAAAALTGDRRVGVIWHTQGSGKSWLMAFYAGMLVQHPALQNPTLVILTDRNDLDDQLFDTFSRGRELIRQSPQQAGNREELRQLLQRNFGGVIFTTLQKFTPEGDATRYPLLTDRRNVVIIADEAHRSQYGFKARLDSKSGKVSYGFAKYVRDALPNASFIGFTGTPVSKVDANTRSIFGDYIDVYDISRAVEDGATVKLYYESRLARLALKDEEKPIIDAEIAAMTEDEAQEEAERLKAQWARVEAVVGADSRVQAIAEDLLEHLDRRLEAQEGKAMVVCMSRRICVKLYNALVRLRPEWHHPDDTQGSVKVVMTGSASDAADFQPHLGGKARLKLLAKRARDVTDPLKLVIVRDMWLTGFDAPCMHTMYIDKPMQGHGLMQAIARVNRVFRTKPAGLIVDYIGIGSSLKSALNEYSPSDQAQTGVDVAMAVLALQEKYEVVRDMFHGFDYRAALGGSDQERMAMFAQAFDWILDLTHEWITMETDAEKKKQAGLRFSNAVLALSKAYSLASATEEAVAIREEVAFFQALRVAQGKSAAGTGRGTQARELAVQQLISRAVLSTDIVDILAAAGLKSPDISILSDEFLAEVAGMKTKNLALEALKKLLNDGLRSRSKTNIVQSKAFSERLEQAMARYHANAITTAEVLQELIVLAKELRSAVQRGEATGLTDEEIAFYDALAENNSALEILGDDKLKVIAQKLVESLKRNITVDWAHRDSARARLRMLVRRILRQFGYPPDLQDAAVILVLQQAEALSAQWSEGV